MINVVVPADGGSIGHFSVDGSLVRVWLRQETVERASQWFYFSVSIDNGQDNLSFSIENAADSLYPRGWAAYRPLISIAPGVWERVADSHYSNGRLQFNVARPPREFSVAYYEPYGVSRYEKWLNELPRDAAAVWRDLSGVAVVSVGQGEQPGAIVIARQHPGESMSSFVIEGLMGFLISQQTEAAEWRPRGRILVVPMMNPTGVGGGFHRFGPCNTDYNRAWGTSTPPGPVAAVKDILAGAPRECVVIDVHGDEVTQSGNGYFIGPSRGVLDQTAQLKVDRFLKSVELSNLNCAIVRKRPYWWRRLRNALRHPHDRVAPFSAGLTASDYCASELGIPGLTLEVPAHGTSADDCRATGAGIARILLKWYG